jgi:hypothetical protein
VNSPWEAAMAELEAPLMVAWQACGRDEREGRRGGAGGRGLGGLGGCCKGEGSAWLLACAPLCIVALCY